MINQHASYINFYPNLNQFSQSTKNSPQYSTMVINASKQASKSSSAAASNAPPHKEKFKQVVPRRKFTPEEDKKIKLLVEKLGTDSWEIIAEYMPDRSARQCRDRYRNYLLDYLCQDPWTCEEDQLIMSKFSKIGAHWVQIAKVLGRRSGNDVKNRWYKHLSKKYNQAMQEQNKGMVTKDENNKENIKFKDQNFLSKKFVSPQNYMNEEAAKNRVGNNCFAASCNIKKIDENSVIEKHSKNNVGIKMPDVNKTSNYSYNYQNSNNNSISKSYQTDSIVENKDISLEAQWRNIECMNIFSNFDHELAFDQTDFTSYIDNFFH